MALAESVGTSLVPVEGGSLPPLEIAVEHVSELAAHGATDALNEARIQAEAHALYELRAQNRERTRYFATLRLLVEAALGVASFDVPDVIPSLERRKVWRCLGAALERGRLLEQCALAPDNELFATTMANRLRENGWATVSRHALGLKTGAESVPWSRARKLASEKAIDLEALPSDAASIRAERDRRAQASRRMARRHRAAERMERIAMRAALGREAGKRGAKTETAYALLRRTLQALHDAQAETMDADERKRLGEVIDSLYFAEDKLAMAFKLRDDSGRPALRSLGRL